jgi:hypothetical protein
MPLPPLLSPIPIHVVDPPGMASWLIALISGGVGFVLAIAAEPLKAHLMEVVTARKVKSLLYRELAFTLLRIEEVQKLSKDNEWEELLKEVPKFASMEWYTAHHLGTVVRADPQRGLVVVEEGLKESWTNVGRGLPLLAASMVKAECKAGHLDEELLAEIKEDERSVRSRRRISIDEMIAELPENDDLLS